MKDTIGDALDYVFSSKTLIFIFGMTVILLFFFILGTVAINVLHWQSPVSSEQLIDTWKWATGAGTARNVISDGVMPRASQIVGAVKDPSVANQPVRPMESSTAPNTEGKVTEYYIPPIAAPTPIVSQEGE